MLAALGVTRPLEGMLFNVEPPDPLSFAIAPPLFLLTALRAGDASARRSGRIESVAIPCEQ